MKLNARWRKSSEHGVSLLLVALGLTILLGMAGLGVDLATLYVARNEAQRAADSAALAGAQQFASANVAEGLMTPQGAEPLAAQNASQMGNQNMVIGQSPNIPTTYNDSCPSPTGASSICFNFSTPNDPRITVVVYANMPTYFMRILGIRSVPVSAVATAEAYVPEGSGPGAAVSCAKPWLLPNCDPFHGGPNDGNHPVNPYCPCTSGPCYDSSNPAPQFADYFVCPENATTCTPFQIVDPGLKPTGSIGEYLLVKAGNPSQTSVASQFNPVFFPGATGTSPPTYSCPTCASNDQQNSTSNSAALYSENIECCSSVTITCGSTPIEPIQGNMVGPTDSGVNCLIHQRPSGKGQDCISLDTSNTCGTPVSLSLPFTLYAGSNNPYGYSAGAQVPTSDSLITMPLYDGEVLCPGNSCAASLSVDVQGYISVFVTHESSGSVYAYVTGVTPCGGAGAGAGGVVIPAAAGNPIPIRLVH